MNLYIESHGKGPNLVLLHGWGLSGNVWEGVISELQQFSHVSIIDLPGYGRSQSLNYRKYTLSNLATEIKQHIEPNSIILGWSLGGMIASQMAVDYPDTVDKLILVASSPQYFKDDDWPHAVSREILESFSNELLDDYKATILHFLAIQALGSEHAQDEIRLLRQRVFRDGLPDPKALKAGLDILLSANLRQQLKNITCPSLIINGQHDRLVPLHSGEAVAGLIQNSQLKLVQGASHAPFISHPKLFVNLVKEFIQ